MIELGQILDGKYRIVRLIGEGGMGAVFEGENTFIHRRVAIKVLHGAASADAGTVTRFEREAQAAGRIGSDHILEILDLGRLPDGSRYMVMEYLDGETFSSRIRRLGRMTAAQIAPIVRQVLVGLDAAHNAGIVHRDLKPDNIFILREKAGVPDFVKIIDFGISKFNALGGDMSMTRTGAVMGTPYYMSPEQAQGSSQVDHRSDLYAVGVIMYEAATGTVPFTGNTFNELMFKIALSTPQPIREIVPDIDPRLAEVVEKAMARDPAARYATAKEMIAALDGTTLPYTPQATPASAAASSTGGEPSAFTPAAGVVTQGSFASSQSSSTRRSVVPLVAAIGGLVVLGGGALAAYAAFGGDSGSTAAASSSGLPSAAPSPEPIQTPTPVASPTPTPAASAEVPAPSPASEPSAAPSSAPSAAPATPKVAAQPKPAVQSKAPAKAPAKKEPASPSVPKSRDFGY